MCKGHVMNPALPVQSWQAAAVMGKVLAIFGIGELVIARQVRRCDECYQGDVRLVVTNGTVTVTDGDGRTFGLPTHFAMN